MKPATKPSVTKRGRPLSEAPARGTHRVRVDLTPEEYADVERIAAREDRTVPAQIGRWIRAGLGRA